MQQQRARIVKAVELVFGNVDDVPGEVPDMQLADGSIQKAYFCDRYLVEGTTGVAEFDEQKRVWRFTPDGN